MPKPCHVSSHLASYMLGGRSKLLAQMAAAEAVDGCHFLEDLLPAMLEFGQV